MQMIQIVENKLNENIDPRQCVTEILRELSKRLAIPTEQNVEDIMGWTLQLSYDTGEDLMKCYSLAELGVEFQRIVSIAIDKMNEE